MNIVLKQVDFERSIKKNDIYLQRGPTRNKEILEKNKELTDLFKNFDAKKYEENLKKLREYMKIKEPVTIPTLFNQINNENVSDILKNIKNIINDKLVKEKDDFMKKFYYYNIQLIENIEKHIDEFNAIVIKEKENKINEFYKNLNNLSKEDKNNLERSLLELKIQHLKEKETNKNIEIIYKYEEIERLKIINVIKDDTTLSPKNKEKYLLIFQTMNFSIIKYYNNIDKFILTAETIFNSIMKKKLKVKNDKSKEEISKKLEFSNNRKKELEDQKNETDKKLSELNELKSKLESKTNDQSIKDKIKSENEKLTNFNEELKKNKKKIKNLRNKKRDKKKKEDISNFKKELLSSFKTTSNIHLTIKSFKEKNKSENLNKFLTKLEELNDSYVKEKDRMNDENEKISTELDNLKKEKDQLKEKIEKFRESLISDATADSIQPEIIKSLFTDEQIEKLVQSISESIKDDNKKKELEKQLDDQKVIFEKEIKSSKDEIEKVNDERKKLIKEIFDIDDTINDEQFNNLIQDYEKNLQIMTSIGYEHLESFEEKNIGIKEHTRFLIERNTTFYKNNEKEIEKELKDKLLKQLLQLKTSIDNGDLRSFNTDNELNIDTIIKMEKQVSELETILKPSVEVDIKIENSEDKKEFEKLEKDLKNEKEFFKKIRNVYNINEHGIVQNETSQASFINNQVITELLNFMLSNRIVKIAYSLNNDSNNNFVKFFNDGGIIEVEIKGADVNNLFLENCDINGNMVNSFFDNDIKNKLTKENDTTQRNAKFIELFYNYLKKNNCNKKS